MGTFSRVVRFFVSMARKLYLVRHGNHIAAVDPLWVTRADRPFDPGLSPDGLIQAIQLAQRLRRENIAHIFSSPSLRAVETACQVAKVLGLAVKIEEGLSEWLDPHVYPEPPAWLPTDVLAQDLRHVDEAYRSMMRPHHPESREDARARVAVAAKMLLERFAGNLLLVGDGGSVIHVAHGLVDQPPPIRCGPCSLVTLVHVESTWQVELAGDPSHLEGKPPSGGS